MVNKKEQPKPQFYYDIKVETMLPATLHYRILAETPEQAADKIKNIAPNMVKHKLIGRRDIKLAVYKAGCSIIEHLRNLTR